MWTAVLGDLVCVGIGHLLEGEKSWLEGGEQTRAYGVWKVYQVRLLAGAEWELELL